jgi:hypothetical protein
MLSVSRVSSKCILHHLTKYIQRAHHAQAQYHGTPKAHVIQHSLALDPLRSLQHHNRELAHLCQEAISPNFLRDARHNNLVSNSTNQEGDECCHRTSDMRSRGAIDVSTEEVVYGDIPFARELEPVGTVPPIGVEVSICEA